MKKIKCFSLLLFIIFTSQYIKSQTGWVQQYSGTTNKINNIYFPDVNTGYACADSGLFLKTTNSGLNWIVYNTGFLLPLRSVRFFNSSVGIIASNKLIRTTDGGVNWYMARDSVFAFDLYVLNSSVGYIAGGNIPTRTNNLKTTNAGENWIDMTQLSSGQSAVYFINENTGYVGWYMSTASYWGSLGISKTVNGGLNWITQHEELAYHGICKIYDVFFPSINTGFAVGYNYTAYKLFKTYNGGTNWIADPFAETYSVYFANVFTGWICGKDGIIEKTTNSGQSWFILPTQFSSNYNSVYFVDYNTGWIAGDNGIILKTTTGGIVPVEPISTEIPNAFSLSQNYPNPFNPSTMIKFDLPKHSFTNLVIYDILGCNTAVLVNMELEPGSYAVDWDAGKYPSGIYFYRIQTDNYIVTKKMLHIK